MPVTVQTGNDFQNLTNGSNGNLSSSLPRSQPSSHSAPSSSAKLLSSIIALSSLSDGSYVTPFMNQLYKYATCLPESMIPISIDIPIPTSDVSTVVKNPLHIPSISSVSLSVAEETSVVSSSPSKISTVQVSSVETTIPNIPSAPEAIPAQNMNLSPCTSSVTMIIPSVTTTKTTSVISIGINIPPINEVREEFNEYFVVSLGEYQYSKTNRSVVRKGRKRN